MTKEELREYRHIDKNIKLYREQIQVLQSEAQCMTARLKEICVDSSGEKDRLSGQIAKIIELKNRLYELEDRLLAQMKRIHIRFGCLPEREKNLMMLRYVKGMTWEQIAVEMGYAWRQIHRIHSMALKRLK